MQENLEDNFDIKKTLGITFVDTYVYIYIYIYIYTYSQFIYLALLYLVEAVIIMPSPRNHILDFLNLAVALSGNGQSAKSKFSTTSTSLITKFKIRLR